MTSKCSTVAPPSSQALTADVRSAKSADNSEGAILIVMNCSLGRRISDWSAPGHDVVFYQPAADIYFYLEIIAVGKNGFCDLLAGLAALFKGRRFAVSVVNDDFNILRT